VSRVERRRQTRAAVLEAAARVFATRGFAGASTEEIAAEAGFTRGAVYSNFADKTDLFLAVLDQRLDSRAAEVAALVEGTDDPAAFFAALAAANEDRPDGEERTWELLRVEFRLYAARNPEVRDRLVEANRRLLDWVADAVRAVFERAGIDPPLPYGELGAIVQGLDEGLCMLRIIDPDRIRPDLFLETLGLLFELASGTSPGTARSPRRPG
jgi:AcrR family transcriptional regulator